MGHRQIFRVYIMQCALLPRSEFEAVFKLSKGHESEWNMVHNQAAIFSQAAEDIIYYTSQTEFTSRRHRRVEIWLPAHIIIIELSNIMHTLKNMNTKKTTTSSLSASRKHLPQRQLYCSAHAI